MLRANRRSAAAVLWVFIGFRDFLHNSSLDGLAAASPPPGGPGAGEEDAFGNDNDAVVSGGSGEAATNPNVDQPPPSLVEDPVAKKIKAGKVAAANKKKNPAANASPPSPPTEGPFLGHEILFVLTLSFMKPLEQKAWGDILDNILQLQCPAHLRAMAKNHSATAPECKTPRQIDKCNWCLCKCSPSRNGSIGTNKTSPRT